MRRAHGYAVFALLMLSVIATACEESAAAPSNRGIEEFFLMEIASSDWQEVAPQRVDAGAETSDQEWVLFYREGAPPGNPIVAIAYRLILDRYARVSNKSPSFVAYDLEMPCDGYMCQCECRAKRAELLSAYQGPELIIQDKCDEEWTRLRAYRWITETMEYQLLAHFDGDDIRIERDQVTIDNYASGGADLAIRCQYFPQAGALLFNEKDAFVKCECVFPNGLPKEKDILTSPHPETVVLAIYNQTQYTGTVKMQPYFAEGVWDSIGGWGVGQLGCPTMSSPVARVRVLGMDIAENRAVRDRVHEACPSEETIATADQAIVVVDACCEYMDGSECERGDGPIPVPVMWSLIWEENGWRVQGPPTQGGE
ncbi:MAG TPA: hypothetical protein G4N99_07330 [Thermoflexia bacterium]|nr:hypothetical protein [Thermoflexia bacterium]